MYPFFHIGAKTIPTYGCMLLIGIALGCLLVYRRCKNDRKERANVFSVSYIALAGAMAGAILLRPIMRVPDMLIHWDTYAQMQVGSFFRLLFGEVVFYGGLIGGATAAFVYCRICRLPFLRVADRIAPAIPLGHAWGRVGCLLAGCCYGLEVPHSHPFALIYPERGDALASVTAPAGVPLLAVPLIESAGNLIIVALILLSERKRIGEGQSIALYAMLYAIQRFTLEFYRGDLVRGIYNGISTSQFISIVLFAGAAALLAVLLIRGRRNPPPVNKSAF